MATGIIITALFVVAALVMGYSWGQASFKESLDKTLKQHVKKVDEEMEKKYLETKKKDISDAIKITVNRCYQEFEKKENALHEKKLERMRKNKEFEDNQPEECKISRNEGDSIEGFMLWSLLTSGYCMERSLELDGQIQTVCNRIVSYLQPHELDIIFQIDRELCENARELFISLDDDVIRGMNGFNEMLRRKSDNESNKKE